MWKGPQRTHCESHDHVACHPRAILPAADADILSVYRDGCVEDDQGGANCRVGVHDSDAEEIWSLEVDERIDLCVIVVD
jgi:hypothetical protein